MYNNYNQNQNQQSYNQQNQIVEIARDQVNDFSILSNGSLVRTSTMNYNTQLVGKLISTNTQGVYQIFSNKANNVIGMFDINSKVIQLAQQQQPQMNSYNTSLPQPGGGMNMSNQSQSGIVGDTIYGGSIAIGNPDVPVSSFSSNPTTPISQNTPTPAVKENTIDMSVYRKISDDEYVILSNDRKDFEAFVVGLTPMEGYSFRPVPVSYGLLSVVTSGSEYKLKMKSKGENEMDINKHNDIYRDLYQASREEVVLKAVELDDGILNLNDSLLDIVLDAVLDSKDPITITSVDVTAGYYLGHSELTTKVNEDDMCPTGTVYIKDRNNLIRNDYYHSIVKISTDLASLMDNMNHLAKEKHKSLMRRYIAGIYKEVLSTVDSGLNINVDKLNPYNETVDLIEAIESIDDMKRKAILELALTDIYNRLTSKTSISQFTIVGDYLSSIENKSISAGGLTERQLMVISREVNIEIEISELIRINDFNVFKVTDSTPGLASLSKAIFNNNLKLVDESKFDISNYTNVPTTFILVVRNYRLRVVRSISKEIMIYREK